MYKNIFATLAAILLITACSRTRTITTQDGTVSVDQGKNGASSIHAVGKDGASVDINTGKAVSDYPSDVPLYTGKTAMDVKSGEKHARMVVMQTSDSLDKINGFYKSELESKGWKVETTLNTEKMVMYKASKDNRDLVVQISSDGSGKEATVSQTLADKDK